MYNWETFKPEVLSSPDSVFEFIEDGLRASGWLPAAYTNIRDFSRRWPGLAFRLMIERIFTGEDRNVFWQTQRSLMSLAAELYQANEGSQKDRK